MNGPDSMGSRQTARPDISRLRIILFDLDGTLIDSTPDLTQSANYVRRSMGLSSLSLDDVRSYVGDGARILIQRCLQGHPECDAAAALQLFLDHYALHCSDFSSLYAGCREALKRLSSLILAVVTNKPDSMSRLILRAYGLDRHISVLVGGDTAPQRKPHPAHLQLALQQTGCLPQEALMVGDGPNDHAAALAAGVPFCGVRYGLSQPLGPQGQSAEWQIDSLEELAAELNLSTRQSLM